MKRGLVAVDDLMAAMPKERREAIEARGAVLLARIQKRMRRQQRMGNITLVSKEDMSYIATRKPAL